MSAGVTLRASDRDCTKVSVLNGGCANGDGRTTGVNSDNGNLNFDQWDFVNQTLQATMDIQGTWQNYGFFVRPTAFYDFVYAENDLRFRDLDPNAKDQLDYDFDVLDAFVYGNWDIGGHYTTVRFGKQVLNWGESLFIQGGINSFQAVDVTRIRTPGAELKDALTPMPIVFASTTLTPNLSVEAFWQFKYEYTELDPAGSFFSTDDITGRGSLPGLLSPNVDNPDLAGPPGGFPPSAAVPIAVRRSSDRIESETDQFGMAVRYYAEELGDGVDFGLYAVRYTSRLPYLGFTTGPDDLASACAFVAVATGGALSCAPGPTQAAAVNAAFAYAANQGKYFYSFPTIETLGASFATTISGTAVSGEISYSPNMPFGVSDLEQNASQLDGTGGSGPITGSPGPISSLPAAGPNQDTVHMIELDAIQGQIGTVKLWSTTDPVTQFFRADTATFLFNAGFVYVQGASNHPLNRVGPEGAIRNPFAAGLFTGGVTNAKYADDMSYGYRMVLAPSYSNALGTPITLTPSISWRHDLQGNSPGPNTANYLQGMKQVSIGLSADYQNTWRGNISYTNIFGAGFDNPTHDRDFISASLSYSF
ncbi:MAG: DUF1302 domain-containing protein [Parvibaculum sp.]|nr:DUF1302 domain-containing protein [Parvibaculum sp.]